MALRRGRARFGAGLSGGDEEAAFEGLPSPSEREVEHVAHLVLMALLPAVADADIDTFGAALTEIQEINRPLVRAVQGGTFAPGPSEAVVRRCASGAHRGSARARGDLPCTGSSLETRPARAWPISVRAECRVHLRTCTRVAFPEEGARIWTGHARVGASDESSIS